MKAVEVRQRAEAITHVLYPSDKTYNGKELRLKQQYLFVSATLQDVVRRFKKRSRPWSSFATKNAIQLNDTHPSIGVSVANESMRGRSAGGNVGTNTLFVSVCACTPDPGADAHPGG